MLIAPDSFYTGIGSRSSPSDVTDLMTGVAETLERLGMKLRSGGADGADAAFEAGISSPSMKVIYLPWEGFNGLSGNSYISRYTEEHENIAKKAASHWPYMKKSVKSLHTRNAAQVLGDDCRTPSSFLVCWTPKGDLVGGTATAMRIAIMNGIPLYNMYYEGVKAACRDLVDTGMVNNELWSRL